MPSAQSWKSIIDTINLGHFLKSYPYYMERDGDFLIAVKAKNVRIVSLVTFLMLLVNISTFVLFGIGAYFYSENPIVSLLCLGPMVLFFLYIGFEFWCFRCNEEIYSLILKYTEFSNQLGVTNIEYKDGYEGVIKTIALTYNFVNRAVIPAVLGFGYFTDNSLTRTAFATMYGVFRVLSRPFGISLPLFVQSGAIGVMTLFGCIAAINGNFCVQLFVDFALLYTLFTKESVERLRLKVGASKRREIQLKTQSEYASHQVLNKIGNDVFKSAVEFALYTGCTVLIISIYALLTLATNINYAALSIIFCSGSISAFVSIKYALELGISCHLDSKSFLDQCKTVFRNNKYDKRFWTGRKPLIIQVGDHFTLETMQYVLVVFGSIVLENVISLLIASS